MRIYQFTFVKQVRLNVHSAHLVKEYSSINLYHYLKGYTYHQHLSSQTHGQFSSHLTTRIRVRNPLQSRKNWLKKELDEEFMHSRGYSNSPFQTQIL